MNTNNTLVPAKMNVALIKDSYHVGFSIMLAKSRDYPQVLCALREILDFDGNSVQAGKDRGCTAMVNATVRREVLEKWRNKVASGFSHIGYCHLTEADLPKIFLEQMISGSLPE